MAAYEILLLNTAIPQIQAAQSGDTYVVPRDIAFSAALTLSAGTANGVPYLNASKVLTTGSALTFDGTNLKVGNATFAPNTNLAGNLLQLKSASGFAYLTMGNGDGANNTGYIGSASGLLTFGSVTDAGVTTEAMRLTSTGLGIGTSSPAYKLDVAATSAGSPIASMTRNEDNTNAASNALVRIRTGGSSGGDPFLQFTIDAQVDYSIGLDNSASDALVFSRSAALGTNNQMVLDSSGNLGLGVTPSAWRSTNKALQVAQSASLFGYTASNIAALGNNVFINSAGDELYINDGTAAYYRQNGNAHEWYRAASGTAGNLISFTQAMTLDASGNLGIGETNPSTILNIKQSTGPIVRLVRTSNRFELSADNDFMSLNARDASTYINFKTGDTERARITSGGYFKASNTGAYFGSTGSYHEFRNDVSANYVLYATHNNGSSPYGATISYTAVSPNGTSNQFLECGDTVATRAEIRSNGGLANYSANNVNLSDRREKTNFAPAKSYLDTICSIPVQTFNYIDQSEDDPGLTLGVVAQDVQAVAPELVMESNWGTKEDPKMRLSIYQTDLQYALMKALQELKAEFDAYKATHP